MVIDVNYIINHPLVSRKSTPAPIIIDFAGGLGNQFFQFMMGLYVHEHTKRPLLFDITGVQKDEKRSLLITQCNVGAYMNPQTIIALPTIPSDNTSQASTNTSSNTSPAITKSIKSLIKRPLKKIVPRPIVRLIYNMSIAVSDVLNKCSITFNNILLIDEIRMTFIYYNSKPQLRIDDIAQQYLQKIIQHIQKYPNKIIYISGYWQYYSLYTQTFTSLQSLFQVSLESLSSNTQELLQTLSAKPHTCSIHIRRTDYLSFKGKYAWPLLSMQYYQRAVAIILSHHPQCEFFVFSDDPQWCHTHLDISAPFTVVSETHSHTEYDDLALMNNCTHHILTNSSFSWWGSSLPYIVKDSPSHKEGITIAPQQWYDVHQPPRNALIQNSNWITLDD